MENTNFSGTGNSQVKASKALQIALNNVSIEAVEVNAFINYLKLNKPVTVKFLNPKIHRWGTAYIEKREIKLYRQSVWVFLHELAHIVSFDIYNRFVGHKKEFGETLDLLLSHYKQFIGG